MLEPYDRLLLMEGLRPPAGYRLHRAIGTTFSLDLLALLTVPLAFTLFDWQDSGGQPTKDPIALLDALRHHADRISIFCQSGQIIVPTAQQTLYGYLEDSVIEVNARNPHGVFHPKVWVLRFEPHEEASGDPILYRVLVLSRNLTFDRSWDVVLRLDGVLTYRRNAFSRNHPLGDFIQALPTLAQRRLAPALLTDLQQIQHDLRRVQFELPPDINDMKFWPLGHRGGQNWPLNGRIDRILVISPFLASSMLKRITQKGQGHVLVSLPESLTALDIGTRNRFESLKVLAETASPELVEPVEPDDTEPMPITEVSSEGGAFPLTGLHAKLYVADMGWNSRVWVGSANATEMAFNGNVEFLVELTGKKGRYGIDSLLSQHDNTTTLADLLQDYHHTDVDLPSDLQKQIEKALESVRRSLARANLCVRVDTLEDRDQFRLTLLQPGNTSVCVPKDMRVWIRPIMLHDGAQVEIHPEKSSSEHHRLLAEFPRVSFEALTSFFAVRIEAHIEKESATAAFVINLPLQGAPADRRERLLRTVLRNRDDVLRYLRLLLTDSGLDAAELTEAMSDIGYESDGNTRRVIYTPLFEALMRALYRNPTRLDEIAHLVQDLRQDEGDRSLLPDGFDTIWEPIWSIRKGGEG